ncbi:hypothetical protein HZA86_04530 [Candidatus Uhrbacteria bacterium]|nr:hypothetical protein [Candidatus Uhrbacteria bacterium]
MLIYGITMQGKKEEVPSDVAAWLVDRMKKYPTVDFTIDRDEMTRLSPQHREQTAELMKKFSRFFYPEHKTRGENGVLIVVFPYQNEIWSVRITGGLDGEGNIIGRSDPEINTKLKRPLPAQLRNDIAGLTEEKNIEQVQVGGNEGFRAKVRREDEPLLSEPREFFPLPAELKWLSEMTMSGEQFNNLMSSPEKKERVVKALYEKDWGALRKLRGEELP